MPDTGFERPEWAKCGEATYEAVQTGLTVTLTATGKHPKAGYDVRFRQLPQDVFPPEFAFEHQGQAPKVSGMIKETTFTKAHDIELPPHTVPIEAISVTDAKGKQKVKIRQSPRA